MGLSGALWLFARSRESKQKGQYLMVVTRVLRYAFAAFAAVSVAGVASGQGREPDAGMLRYPDVSKDQIVFVYANDLWVAPREGGVATALASPDGQELFPRFSPDGSEIVFQGNYEGDRDLYTLPVTGGIPQRLTHHPSNETPTDWHESGIVFHMSGAAGLGRQQQIFRVSPGGGLPEQLPPAYGANGVISADGEWLAYTPSQRDFRTWKRYRGGLASDIWLMNLRTLESEKITDHEGTDTLPMWHRNTVYYLSDAGPEHKLNIWSYDVRSGDREQVTDFEEYDCKFPSIGPGDGQGEIVLSNGPGLYRVDLRSGRAREVEITIPGARPTIAEKTVDAAGFIQSGGISSTGKRVVVEARGDVWTLPAEHGAPRQLTTTDGAAERNPAWSPDGRWIAYFSDESGEYNLYVTQSDGKGETRKLTDEEENYFFEIVWAPDSESMVLKDKRGALHLVDLETGSMVQFDRDTWANQPPVSWSGDSRWIAYSVADPDSGAGVIKIYDTETAEAVQVTSGFFSDTEPVFSKAGDYLYYASSREFTSPQYESLGTTFVYANTERIIAVPLNAEVENEWLIEPDDESWDEDEGDDEEEAGEGDADGDDEEGDDADAEELSVLVGTWSAKATGLAAMGLPSDELDYMMYFTQLEDGTFVGASEQQGETQNYDSVEFDEDSGKLVLKSSQGPVSSTVTTTVRAADDGATMSGTWEVTGVIEGSGPVEAERTSQEVPDDKIDEDAGGGASDDPVEIDFDGFEARGVQLDVSAGSFSGLASNDSGALLYNRMDGGAPSVRLIDASDDEPAEKTVVSGAFLVDVSGDGKKILLAGQGNRWKIADAKPGQSMADAILPSGLRKRVDPREEWRQLFTDAWRRHRDFFYVQNMHGVDWDGVRERYSRMLDDAVSREDVSFIIGEMISELNVGHAYYFGGDVEDQPLESVGMLGADFELATEDGEEAYRISKLYSGAPWDTDARNPLDLHGVDIEEGVYLTHVNGSPVDTDEDPWAAFVGTAGQETTLTFADALTGDEESRNVREVTIKPIGSEAGLRYRAWVEHNRAYVEEETGGRVGYIYVPNTGVQGQNELFRQFYGQIGKDALIIDERWNGGGQIPTRFIELLNRPRTNYWYRRDGKDWGWPPDSHQGPKAMLINGAAGSGGDMFPWLFKENGLGKLIGQRTWGGLVGISGVPPLIDGGYTAVPNFGFYEKDGTWGIEGHGVDPDLEVVDDPTELAEGNDPQLDAAIEHLVGLLDSGEGYERPERPTPPDRSGFGIAEDDK